MVIIVSLIFTVVRIYIVTFGCVSNLLGCSEHSEMMENHANHPKICHRGDGQCTCYYCTIFGHSVSLFYFVLFLSEFS